MDIGESEMQACLKAEKDAEDFLTKQIDSNSGDQDITLMYKYIIARRLNIGIFDKYFDDLNIYQLAFEAYLYGKESVLKSTTPEQRCEQKMLDDLLKDDVVLPPGFEDLTKEDLLRAKENQ
jgi:hypothetical protein